MGSIHGTGLAQLQFCETKAARQMRHAQIRLLLTHCSASSAKMTEQGLTAHELLHVLLLQVLALVSAALIEMATMWC